MFKFTDRHILKDKAELATLPSGKLLINTINAYSYNQAQKDNLFADALRNGDILIPDGMSVVVTFRLKGWADAPTERVAGWDLFEFEMRRLNDGANSAVSRPVCMFMGSSEKVLSLIREKVNLVYPNLEVVTYSPPYRQEFTDADNKAIINAINAANPDLLWIGMTAPKQEKWIYSHWNELDIHCHCGTIGAVFDFFAGTAKRAPVILQRGGLEWLYRLIKEPRRLYRRYIFGNISFLYNILRE